MDINSEKKLAAVHPELARRVRLLAVALLAQGTEIRVVQGFRTPAEQQALFDQGRTKPGHIVTNARPFQSNHNYGLAVDLCPFKNGQPQWNDVRAFQAIGRETTRLGLEWGGAWKHIVDQPHIQLSGLSIARCYALYRQGGLPAVWKEATRVNSAPHVAMLSSLQSLKPETSPMNLLTLPHAVNTATKTSRYLTWLGIIVGTYGAVDSQFAALLPPKYAPFVMFAGLLLTAFNERAHGGLSKAKEEVAAQLDAQEIAEHEESRVDVLKREG